MIEIRKLAAVDMAWLGARFVIPEYVVGIILPAILGVLSLRSGADLLGLWLIGIAANYIPLCIYAILIARAGTVKAEGEAEIAHARRYGLQQVIILVPLLVVIVALVQEGRRRKIQ